MGYVNVTDISQFISPFQCGYTAGTWTPTVASDIASNNRTAAAATFDILIPIPLPSSDVGVQGAKLVSIDVFYKTTVAALADFATVELDKVSLPAGVAAGANPAVTIDGSHDTANERKGTGSHMMTVTLDTPVFIDDLDTFVLHVGAEGAGTSVFAFYGARANYTLRL